MNENKPSNVRELTQTYKYLIGNHTQILKKL